MQKSRLSRESVNRLISDLSKYRLVSYSGDGVAFYVFMTQPRPKYKVTDPNRTLYEGTDMEKAINVYNHE